MRESFNNSFKSQWTSSIKIAKFPLIKTIFLLKEKFLPVLKSIIDPIFIFIITCIFLSNSLVHFSEIFLLYISFFLWISLSVSISFNEINQIKTHKTHTRLKTIKLKNGMKKESLEDVRKRKLDKRKLKNRFKKN